MQAVQVGRRSACPAARKPRPQEWYLPFGPAHNRHRSTHRHIAAYPHRDGMIGPLAQGNPTGIHYPIPVHSSSPYADLGNKTGDFPVTESIANQELSLPNVPS